MNYKVINRFRDLQDSGYVYNVDDVYPRDGYKPTADRINELATGTRVDGNIYILKQDLLDVENNEEELVESETIEDVLEELSTNSKKSNKSSKSK